MTALEHLRTLDIDDQAGHYPNVPRSYIVSRVPSDKTANGLTRCIILYLHLHGHQAERISIEGRTIDQRQTFTDSIGRTRTIGSVKRIPTTMTRGSADISAIVFGRSVKIEVKVGRDRQSDDQRKYQAQVENAGGVYLIIRSLEELHQWYLTQHPTP